MLIAPDAALGPDDGALLGLKGITAALIGGLVSLRLALLGGLVLGVLEAFVVGRGSRSAGAGATCIARCAPARRSLGREARMTDLAFDLYLLAAALGLVPAVAFAGMPVLAQSAFLALGAVGAMQLERAGLPIGSAVLLAVLGGAVAGALLGVLLAPAPRGAGRARDLGTGLARDHRAARVPRVVRRHAGADAAGARQRRDLPRRSR